MTTHPRYWFRAKRYGWGWGLPQVWQGWVVLAAFLVLTLAGVFFVLPSYGALRFNAYLAVMIAALVAVCWLKGGPPRWSWGEADTAPVIKVVDHEPAAWFLVQDGKRLLFDVNCSHGAVSHEFLMELNASERADYAARGRRFLSELAERIQSSAPGARESASPYRERLLQGPDRARANEASIAWLKDRAGAA